MATGYLSPIGLILQAFSDQGVVGAGYLINVYKAGSTTPVTTYTDSTLGTANSNPIVLRSNGRLPYSVWVPQGTVVKMVLTDAQGNAIAGGTVDNLPSINDVTVLQNPQTAIEAANGVTPTNYNYPAYDVRRYGAVGDGVTNDTAAFAVIGTLGVTGYVPEAPVSWLLNSTPAGLFQAFGKPRFSGAGVIGLTGDVGVQRDENNSGVVGSWEQLGTVLMIGDSITQGTGSTTYVNSYAWEVGRSLMNATNEGILNDTGLGYHHMMQMSSFITSPGVTNNGGTITAAGIWNSRLNLTGSNTLAITLREIQTFDIYYDGTASAGCTFTIKLNGTTVFTTAASGSGLRCTALGNLKANGMLTRLSDVITIGVTAGTLQLCCVLEQKTSNQNASRVYIAGQSGYAYQDYTSAAAITELVGYITNPSVPVSCTIICNLGTNNMYNASKALSPAATVAQITTFLNAMVTALGTAGVVSTQLCISIPPKSNEALFPMILTQYKYEDYLRAIMQYALQTNVTLIRHDLGNLGTTLYYVDGLHPNDVGHTIFANSTLKALGVKFDKFFKSIDFTSTQYQTLLRTDYVPTYNSTWASFGGLAGFALRATLNAGMVHLSGIVIPAGAVSTTIATLPAALWPTGQDRYCIVPVNVSGGTLGFARLQISSTSGALIISTVPSTDVSFDGISYPLYKNIES